MLDELLPYYEDELTSLRSLSAEFARRYPKIASRLLMEGDVCEDPHVERLIESFAFIAARINKKLDDDFPQITEALLSVLYPHFLRPIPSMSIAQLTLAPGSELTTVQHVARGTPLLTRPIRGMPVRYRSAYAVDVWPVAVRDVRFESVERSAFAVRDSGIAAHLRIRIECTGKTGFAELDIQRLRFYLDGESPLVHTLHEVLLNNTAAITLLPVDGDSAAPPLRLDPSHIVAVGFDEDQGLLDYDPRSFLGYRLIQEYFALPEKFLFIDITGLNLKRFGRAVELRIALNAFGRPERAARLEQTIDHESLRLNCTPIVNLFSQQGEPIRVSQELHQYPVVPDVRQPLGMEVYSIDSVRRLARQHESAKVTEFLPFYSTRHGLDNDAGCYWYAQRLASSQPDDEGTDVAISLVDRDMNPTAPSVETLTLSLTCTNRDLPSQLPYGGNDSLLHVEGGNAISQARLLKKPTPTSRAPMRMANQWRLISHLALNHLSIVDGGRDALLEILSLYNFNDSPSVRKHIAGIIEVGSRPILTRIGKAPRQAFVRGTGVELKFDEEQYVGSGAYLLARVLDHFFGLYCTANSYTQLTVRSAQREEPLARFVPRAGAQALA